MNNTLEQLTDILKRGEHCPIFPEKARIQENAALPFFAEERAKLKAIAEDAIEHPSHVLPFSEYKVFDTEGSRAGYDDHYMARRMKLNALVFTAMVEDDPRYITALEDEIWVWLNEFCWSMPSGMHGMSLDLAGVDGCPQELHLDLCATEMGYTLAEIDCLLGDRLSPFIRYRMEQEVRRRVLDSYRKYHFHWEDCDNNWAAVCGGSVGAAAIYYIHDSAELAPYLLRVMNTLDCFLSGYDSDGACVEGVSYWCYGFSYYIFISELIRQRTDGAIDLLMGEKQQQMAFFLERSRIVRNEVINFSDCAGTFTYRIGMLHKLKARFPEVGIPPTQYAMRYHADHCYRWPGFIRDYAWYDPALADETCDRLSDGFFFRESQIFTSRKNGAFFAVTGGNNGYSHNHNDLGHFLYYCGGEGIFMDIGQGVYVKEYFSDGRYNIINNSARGHSVPQIGGCLEKEGSEHHAEMTVERGEADKVTLDLTAAYDCPVLNALTRTFTFAPDGALTLRDTIRVSEPSAIVEQFLVEVTEEPIVEDGYVLLRKNGVTVRFTYGDGLTFAETEALPASVRSTNQTDGLRILKFMASDCMDADFTFQLHQEA